MQTCICDKCSQEIEIDLQETTIEKDKDGNDIVEQFFICPMCSKRYTVIILDQFMKQKIAARKRLKRNPQNFNKTLDATLMKQMQNHYKILKNQYGIE